MALSKNKFINLFLLLVFLTSALSPAIAEKKFRISRKKREKIDFIVNSKGTWVNIWNYPKDLNKFIARLEKFGLDTIYLQVNRSTTEPIKDPAGVDRILKAAHEHDIKVVGWSYCYLDDISKDIDRFLAIAKYESPQGHKFDATAADIEENTALWAVKTYTKKIKRSLPKDYPLVAIVYSPKIRQEYPWEYVANNWDVLMPMTYWHGHKNRSQKFVYDFVKDSITDLRRLTKKRDLNIHLITDGDNTSTKEVATSIKAARDFGVNAGVSIYPEHLASDEMFSKLSVF